MSDSESSTDTSKPVKKPSLLSTLRDKRVALEKEKAEKKSIKKVVKKEEKKEPELEPVIKPKKKTIVYMEESSSEEEVIVKRHKPKSTPAPPPPPTIRRKPSVPKHKPELAVPAVPEVLTGYNLLDNLLFSRR